MTSVSTTVHVIAARLFELTTHEMIELPAGQMRMRAAAWGAGHSDVLIVESLRADTVPLRSARSKA